MSNNYNKLVNFNPILPEDNYIPKLYIPKEMSGFTGNLSNLPPDLSVNDNHFKTHKSKTMGFSERKNRGSGKFINIKKGELVNNGKIHGAFTGLIVDLWIKEEVYNNEPYEKLTIALLDEEDNKIYELGVKLSSGYGYSFFCMCPNINPKLPVTFSAGMSEAENGHKFGRLFAEQEGKSIKWFYSQKDKENFSKIPTVKETTVGTGKHKKVVKDYSDRDAFIEKVIAGFLEKKVRAAWPGGIEAVKKLKQIGPDKTESEPENDNDAEPEDDLPF